jgi:hypothetical protein
MAKHEFKISINLKGVNKNDIKKYIRNALLSYKEKLPSNEAFINLKNCNISIQNFSDCVSYPKDDFYP